MSSRRLALQTALLALPLGGVAAPQKVPLLVSPRLARPLWLRVYELLGRAGGWDFDVQVRPFARAELEVGRGAGLMLGLSPNPARERRLRFSRPVAEFRAWVLGPAFEGAPQLKGRRVCVAHTSPSAEPDPWLEQQGAIQIGSSQGSEGHVRMLRAGRCEWALVTVRGADAEGARRTLRAVGADPQGMHLTPTPLEPMTLHFSTSLEGPWLDTLGRLDMVLQREAKAIEDLLNLPE